MAEKFKNEDFVWAKMKGFQPWPGRVTTPPSDQLKKKKGAQHWIYFFGTKNCAWIDDKDILDYEKHKEKLSKQKSKGIREAIKDLEEYIEFKNSGGVEEEPDIFDQLKNDDLEVAEEEVVAVKPKKVRKRKDTHEDAEKSVTKRAKKSAVNGESSPMSYSSPGPSSSQPRKSHAQLILETPASDDPVRPELDLNASHLVTSKQIVPSEKVIGFVGLGNMGSGMVKNMLATGHKVVVWNRSRDKCERLMELGVTIADTPGDVVHSSELIMMCVTDPNCCRQLIFGNCGIMPALTVPEVSVQRKYKGFVQMTTIDPVTSQELEDSMKGAGCQYLSAMPQGSFDEADSGSLMLICAGDAELFKHCQSAFEAISKECTFLGTDASVACRLALCLNMVNGVCNVALAEAMSLADRCDISQAHFVELFSKSIYASPALISKSRLIHESAFNTRQSLSLVQKDLKLALDIGDSLAHSMPVTAAANEAFKATKRSGYKDHDVAAVYLRARF